MSLDDILFLFMGFALSAFGVKVIIKRQFHTFNYGLVNFGENHQLIGVAILVVGALAIFSVLRKV